MIDIHSHILYGVDDGPETLEQSIEMAKTAVQEGIHTIVATPHHKNGAYENEKGGILQKVEHLNVELKQRDIPLTVLPGQEVRLYGELLQHYEEDRIVTINQSGTYLLVEFPSAHVPRYAETMLYQLQLQGIIPIIAHPERNAEIIENPDILFNLVERGALTQVTAASVNGTFGKKIKKFTLQLLENHLAHLIASDAHNVTNRSFGVNEAWGILHGELGAERVYGLQEAAYAVIAGQYVQRSEPERIRTKRFFKIF